MDRGLGGTEENTAARGLRREPDVGQAWQVLGLVDDAAKHADAKAGVTLAATGLISATLYRAAQSWHRPGVFLVACLAVSGVLLLCAGVCAGLALVPRTRGGGAPSSLVHFGRIAEGYPSGSAYVADLAALTCSREALFGDVAMQAWAMARVVWCKYLWCGRAVRCLLLALVAATAAEVTHTW